MSPSNGARRSHRIRLGEVIGAVAVGRRLPALQAIADSPA